jgi:large subunit ribosomal protein L18
MSTTTRTIPYRRKREDKTNYKKRLKLLLGEKPRLVIRKSLKNILIQIVVFGEKGDAVLASAHTRELRKLGWNFTGGNLPSAYLTGLLIGKKAKAKKCTEAIVDLGMQSPIKGTRLFAAIKGAIDAGMHIPHTPENFPSMERIRGDHISAFEKDTKFKEMVTLFGQCKEKIMKG